MSDAKQTAKDIWDRVPEDVRKDYQMLLDDDTIIIHHPQYISIRPDRAEIDDIIVALISKSGIVTLWRNSVITHASIWGA